MDVQLFRQLIKSITIWLIVLIFIILLVLIPRDVQYVHDGESVVRHYDFSMCEYTSAILTYIADSWEYKSLGTNRFGEPVAEDIQRYVPRSLSLLFIAFIISLAFGIMKGLLDYRYMRTKKNVFGQGSTWVLQSLPDFFLILFFQFFVLLLMRAGFPSIPIFGYGEWYNVIIPSLFLSIYPTFYIARVTSSLLATEEESQYIKTAIAKGITEKVVVLKHLLGNCWAVILTHLSTITVYMISNLLMIEYLMFYQGAAYRLFQAMGYHDARQYEARTYEPELIIGFVIIFTLLVLIIQVISQICRYYIDPRIRDENV